MLHFNTQPADFLLLLLCFSSSAGATGNAGNFADSGSARVDYRRPVVIDAPYACERLVSAGITAGRILSVGNVPAQGADPEYCRVTGVIPRAIRFVVYLPDHWNGRLYMHGNGGDAGEPLDYAPYHELRLNAVRNGFAAAFTNTGHDAANEPGNVWARDDPEREADYGYRAVHVTLGAARQITQTYYGRPTSRSYFDGCSTGGRQGLMEAQRFPEDFDGILAGAPVYDLPDMLWQYRKNSLAVERTPITPERLAQLGEFIRSHYDKSDGVADGVVGDPLAANFLPSRDLPRDAHDPDGFTEEELATLDTIYAPVIAAGAEIFPRAVVGAELPGQVYRDGDRTQVRIESAWVGRVVPDAEGRMLQPLILDSWFRYLAFDEDDADRDWRVADPARDGPRMERMRGVLRATDPGLSTFAGRGGRLILYHGWADFGVNPLRTIQYVEQVAAASARPMAEYLRLYLVPGMFHCAGGVNVDHFDLMTPLIEWVETGRRPEAIRASRVENGRVTRTRPLCPWPQMARYRESGDADAAVNFACDSPP